MGKWGIIQSRVQSMREGTGGLDGAGGKSFRALALAAMFVNGSQQAVSKRAYLQRAVQSRLLARKGTEVGEEG